MLPLPIFDLQRKSKDLEVKKIPAGLTRREGKPIETVFLFCQTFPKIDPIQATDYNTSTALFMIRTYLENSLEITTAVIEKALDLLRNTQEKMLNTFLFFPNQIKNFISDNKLTDKRRRSH